MTKTLFLTAYSNQLILMYPWAKDQAKLDTFMATVAATIGAGSNTGRTWNHSGDAVKAAWKAIGGKGTPTLKALRELAP